MINTIRKIRALPLIAMLFSVFLLVNPLNAYAAETSFTLDGNDIQTDNVNGLTFKGFGVLSANGTSALLMDYKSEQPQKYAELLRILFGGTRPVITQVKIEMGNDRNNSTGPDPATMRLSTEAANVKRHPGFQLAADAKIINPDLKVSILRWNAPGWVSDNDDIYTWYKNTILAAYREYGYMVDYVNPGVNEQSADLSWTEDYANRVKTDTSGFNDTQEQTLYNSIKVVISDEVGTGTFGADMVSDATLRDAVAVAAFHYNTDDDSTGNFTRLAEEFDKEVWNSEGQATFSNSAFRPNNNTQDPTIVGTGIGGTGSALEMGNTIIKGFYKSRRTHFIYQPAIGSFYEGGQYSFKELLSTRDPWSGFIHYDAGLDILRHFSWFAKTGWENSSNSAGIWRVVPEASYNAASGTNPVNGRNGTPSYLTLAAPDKNDFSVIFDNDSEYIQTYHLSVTNMNYSGNPSLEIWETRAANSGQAFNSNYMQNIGTVSADGSGVYTVYVEPFSIMTITTLNNSSVAEFNTPLPVEGERTILDTDATGSVQNTSDGYLYADDFDYSGKTVSVIDSSGNVNGSEDFIVSRGGSQSVIPRYSSDRNGAFEAYLPSGSSNYVLRQQVDQSINGLGGSWNNGNPLTAIGDFRWLNYQASVDVSFEHNSTEGGDNYAAIGVRQQGGSSSHYSAGTPYVFKFWYDGGWSLHVSGSSVASGNVATGSGGPQISGFDTAYDAWHNIALKAAGDTITAYIDGVEIASYVDSSPRLSGRVDLLSGYYHTRFDNLKVEKLGGYAPYYTELLDNLEMYDLSEDANTRLVYSGSWAHANGKSMYTYHRSLSTSQGAGASLEYTFTGTGIDILGPNDGSAELAVTVDGNLYYSNASTRAASEFYQTYSLRHLPYGEHTVSFTVVSGTLVVDAIAVVGSGGVTDNLALNKPVTFSSQQSGNGANHMVDGTTGTRWSAQTFPQWVQIDLGSELSINQTELVPYSDRAYQYTVEVSTDGSNYTEIVDRTANTTGGSLLTDSFTTVSARYVRLTVTGASGYSGDWASVLEFRIKNIDALLSGETYYIKNRHSGKCLRTLDGGSANATSIVQYSCGSNDYEQWTANAIGNDQYNIVQVSSGKYSDISGASTAAGGNNIIWPGNGGDNQKWEIIKQSDGYYHINNVNSGMLLDISGASTADNGNNIQWTDNGGDNQDWEFIAVE